MAKSRKPKRPEMTQEQLLWRDYSRSFGSVESRNALAEFYWYQVLKFVGKFCFQKNLNPDEFSGVAAEALIAAIPKFDLSRKLKFMTFFSYRLKGALLDACRSADPISRLSRKRKNMREEAEAIVGSEADDVRRWLDWSAEQYASSVVPRTVNLDAASNWNSARDEYEYRDTVPNLKELGIRDEIKIDNDDLLREILKGCSYEELVICYLLFKLDKSQVEVANVLMLSPSRISQIRTRVFNRVRAKGRESILESVA